MSHTYSHYGRAYWRALRMGRLTVAAYARQLAGIAATSPRSASMQRAYDRLVLDVIG